MPTDSTPLVEAAVRNFGDDAELQHRARAVLNDLLEASPTQPEIPEEEIIQRWDDLDNRSRRFSWKWILALMVIFGSLTIGLGIYPEARSYRIFLPLDYYISDWDQIQQRAREQVAKRDLSSDQKLLLLGDLATEGHSKTRKALWQSEPDNPAYFSEFAITYKREHEKLPETFLDDASQIDPGNALYPYLAAAISAKDSAKKEKQSSADRLAGKPFVWTILDEAKFNRVLELTTGATNLSFFETYQSEMAAKRIPLLAQDNLANWLNSATILFSTTSATIDLRPLWDAFSAKAFVISQSGDQAGFTKSLASMETFYRFQAIAKNPTLIDWLVLQMGAKTNYRDFAAAATALGQADEALRLGEIAARLEAMSASKQARLKAQSGKDRKLIPGSRFMTANYLENTLSKPFKLDAQRLLPGSFMDHALSGRIMSVCLWVYFLLGLLMVSTNRFLTSRLIRLLAARMENLLKLSDYGWILSLGILAPTVYVFAISRFTSLGGRVWSVQEEVMLIPIAHFSALFLLMVSSSILVGRWRLQKRAGEFGFNDQRPWIGGTAILLALTSVPAIGWVVLKELEEPFLIAAVSLLAPLLLWLLILAFRSPFGSSKNRLMSSMMTRVLMPVFGTGMLIAIILVPIFKAEEGYWFRRFSLAHFNVATAPVTEYEQLVAQKLGEEIREALGYE